jgi:hypothetical protein
MRRGTLPGQCHGTLPRTAGSFIAMRSRSTRMSMSTPTSPCT